MVVVDSHIQWCVGAYTHYVLYETKRLADALITRRESINGLFIVLCATYQRFYCQICSLGDDAILG